VRTFDHWSLKYIYARIKDIIYRKRNPNNPWLTPDAIDLIAQWMKPEYKGLEFGSGRSTVWFAKRVSFLTSIENNPDWYQRVQNWLAEAGLNNVNYFLAGENEKDDDDQTRSSKYLQPSLDIPNESLDFVLIDGRWRSQCTAVSMHKLCPGGIMIIDNANHFLPCDSHAPNSRTIEEGPSSEEWQKIWVSIKDWRRIWTTNSVSDTAIFIKPVC